MIVAGAIIVHHTSSWRSHALVEAYEPRVLEALQRRSDAIHSHGMKLVGQIVHLGRELIGGESDYAPSAPSPIRVLTSLCEVSSEGAHLMNVTSGEEEVVPCGLVVVQTGRTPVTALADNFQEAGMDFHMIGDCATPRRMSQAVFEAHRLAGRI